MTDRQSPAPPERRPWFYKNWFLAFTFILGWPIFPPLVLWPVWPVLILRSPWHKGQFLKTMAWAMLAVGGYVLILQLITGGSTEGVDANNHRQLAFLGLMPGLFVTGITQALWVRYRMDVRNRGADIEPPTPRPEAQPFATRRAKARRRARRAKGHRSSRSSR